MSILIYYIFIIFVLSHIKSFYLTLSYFMNKLSKYNIIKHEINAITATNASFITYTSISKLISFKIIDDMKQLINTLNPVAILLFFLYSALQLEQ